MLSALKVARTTKFQVLLGNLKSIGRIHHYLYTLSRVGRNLIVRHKYAVRLLSSSAHPATQLVELAQSEAFGVFNHHHRSVRHVHTHFYHRRSHHYVSFAVDKLAHFLVLLCRLKFAVHTTDIVILELRTNLFIPVLQVLNVHLLTLLDERIDHIYLAPLLQLLAH